MTKYGFYDNDIMDEEIICDMIHATSMKSFESNYNNPWYSNISYMHYRDKDYEYTDEYGTELF